MLGHLVPISGGKAYVLGRDRVYLGRRPGVDSSSKLGEQTARCRLRYDAGWWYADDLEGAGRVRLNGRPQDSFRIAPNDEVSIGSHRFRLAYAPDDRAVENLETLAASVLGVDEKPQPGADAVRELRKTDPSARESSEPLLGRLVPVGGGQDFPLLTPRVRIGRDKACEIVLPYKTVSSMHCGLELIDGRWQVIDLGSRNGIRVDGVECQKAWVDPRSRLSIAEHRFELDYATDAGPREAGPVDLKAERSLMDKVGASGAAWDDLIARQEALEQDVPQKQRYNLLDDI
ncbi:MAG: FHA domain-containing protein [Planctomycetota bacterium]|nr:MAG: FHA domain-containing protein [Planctomycetota bacterium]REJ92830.1 MAG: FHA domain-containing protein [Planctomycetota bacterium]REK24886.1 MAG: FHA domain-containing protein [Planctomycetota bacterium]